ncbi:MAG: choice-of-anchor Q domain-containing protein [Kiritimatiellia bacterium]|nr:choice-of-anchor Q domain-containing protein [Kiritimatiellia bacterium]
MKRQTARRSIASALALAAGLMMFSGTAWGANWYVATNGTGDGSSWASPTNDIEGAINAAGVGDTVWVTNGVYNLAGNQISVNTNVTVKSVNGASSTIIDGGGSGRIFSINHADALVSGFTIQNGHAGETGTGGGVYLYSGTVEDCDIINNVARHGCGAYMTTGTISRCLIQGNTMTAGGDGYGAGIRTLGGTIDSCRILENETNDSTWSRGGGVWHENQGGNGSDLIIRNCLIARNLSLGPNRGGGGIYSLTDVDIINCTIVSNHTAHTSGGGLDNQGATMTVKNSIVRGNQDSDQFDTGNANANSVSTWSYSCTSPDVGGTSIVGPATWTDLFEDPDNGDYRLKEPPPPDLYCIDAGNNADATGLTFDLAGNPRILDGGSDSETVDMGAYEFVVVPKGTVLVVR